MTRSSARSLAPACLLRRGRCLLAPAVLLLATALPAIAHASVIWTADAEQPASQEWAESSASGAACGIAPPNVTTPAIERVTYPYPVAQGRYSYRFQVSNGDDCWGARAELGQNNPQNPALPGRLFYPGQDRWISFQAYFPNNYQLGDPLGQSTGLLQLKQNGAYGQPALGIGNGTGHLCMFIDSLWYQHYDPNCGDGYYSLGVPAHDRWVKLALHVRFATDNTGFVEVWGDLGDGRGYRQLLSRIYAPTMKTDPTTGQPIPSGARIGIYRSDAITGTEDLYVDGFTVATDEASANENAFAPATVSAPRVAAGATAHPGSAVSFAARAVRVHRRRWIRAHGGIRLSYRHARATAASAGARRFALGRRRVVVRQRVNGHWRVFARGWTAANGTFSLLAPMRRSTGHGLVLRAQIAGIGRSNSVHVR